MQRAEPERDADDAHAVVRLTLEPQKLTWFELRWCLRAATCYTLATALHCTRTIALRAHAASLRCDARRRRRYDEMLALALDTVPPTWA